VAAGEDYPSPSQLGSQVRDALANLYDLTCLQTHALVRTLTHDADPRRGVAGRALQQCLLDAIEHLNPGPGTATSTRAWRRYRILEMRYIEAMSATEVQEQLNVSKSEYYRELGRAVGAVVSAFRERWYRTDASAGPDPGRQPGRAELAQREAEELFAHGAAEALDLGAALGEVVDTVGDLADRMGVGISLSIAPWLGAVQGDRAVLHQAVLHALRQAMNCAAPGAVDVKAEAAGDRTVVAVTALSSTNQPSNRFGLEFEVAQRLVAGLGGELEARATERGCVIELKLLTSGRPRLLVVDNSTDFPLLVARYLSHEGWEILGAASASQGLELARTVTPQAILLDVMMPHQDGWELLRELRAVPETRDIPVVVCSVLNDPQLAGSLGADGYVLKPVSQLDLLRALVPWRSGRRAVAAPP